MTETKELPLVLVRDKDLNGVDQDTVQWDVTWDVPSLFLLLCSSSDQHRPYFS